MKPLSKSQRKQGQLEVYGVPRMLSVYQHLMDLRAIYYSQDESLLNGLTTQQHHILSSLEKPDETVK